MSLAVLILRVAVALQCVGLWRIAFVDNTALGTTLFMTLRWSEADMLAVEHGVAWLGLLAGLSLVARPTRAAAAVVTAWFAVVAVLTAYQGGEFGAAYAPFAHATRFGASVLAFVAAMQTLEPDVRRLWLERIARVAVATTFVAHGVEAFLANPRFIDYVITAFRRVDIAIAESTTRHLLRIIGLHDLVLAALILAKRWRWVAGYMAFWGAVTAASRIVHMGIGQWPATLVRAANCGVPLALCLLWRPASAPADECDPEQ